VPDSNPPEQVKNKVLHSVFRKGFLFQIGLTTAGFLGGALYFLFSSRFYKWGWLISIFLFIFGTIVIYKLFWNYLIRIKIDDRAVYFIHLMKNNPAYILFDEIEKIDLGSFQVENLNGPLTEPVPELEISGKGKKLYLSSSVYANFMEMAFRIVKNYNTAVDRKVEMIAKYLIYKKLKENERQKP
jgi:hypothetical protein